MSIGTTVGSLLLSIAPLLAQDVPGSFEQLIAAGLLQRGDPVIVIEADGRRTEGDVEELSGTSLTLVANGPERRRFSETAAARIELRDSVVNGLLIGAAAGAAAGFLLGAATCSDDPECEAQARAVIGIGGGGAGAGLGTLLDATLRRLVYLSSDTGGRVSLRLSPLLSRRTPGALLVAEF